MQNYNREIQHLQNFTSVPNHKDQTKRFQPVKIKWMRKKNTISNVPVMVAVPETLPSDIKLLFVHQTVRLDRRYY